MGLIASLAEYYKVTVASLIGESLESENEELVTMFHLAKQLEGDDFALLNDMIRSMVERQRKKEKKKIQKIDPIEFYDKNLGENNDSD